FPARARAPETYTDGAGGRMRKNVRACSRGHRRTTFAANEGGSEELSSVAGLGPKTPDDYALMEGIARRDTAALEALYDRHGGLVFTLCRQILRDRDAAEDVLFEVFFELWEKCERYDPSRASAVTYLATVARSRALDRLRSKSAG